MYVKIGNTIYTKFSGLSFDPVADISGNELPINQFVADVITDDNISTGVSIGLYDDSDNLWADYWLMEATRVNTQTIRLLAQSKLLLLDRKNMPAKYYNGITASSAVSEIFSGTNVAYQLNANLENVTITGFCPAQTARQRLQWVAFVIGAYVRSYFSDKIIIDLIDSTETAIPKEKTYWKPSVVYGNYVTAVSITAYTYTQGTPQTTDKWVTDGTNYYIETSQVYSLSNPDVPAGTPDNVVEIKGVGLVNTTNVAGLLSQLSQYFFKRIEVDLEAINNGDYLPADKVAGYADDELLISGFIQQADFTFGLQAKSKLHIMQSDEVECARLTIFYKYGNTRIDKRMYYLPVGYAYNIQNPYIDVILQWIRRVYIPLTASASGTVISGGVEDSEYYDIALEFKDFILSILSVDEVTQSGSTVRIK